MKTKTTASKLKVKLYLLFKPESSWRCTCSSKTAITRRSVWGRILKRYWHVSSAPPPGRRGSWEQPPRGVPWVSGLVGHFVQTCPDSECSHTVQFYSQLNWRCNHYHLFWHCMTVLVLLWGFSVIPPPVFVIAGVPLPVPCLRCLRPLSVGVRCEDVECLSPN